MCLSVGRWTSTSQAAVCVAHANARASIAMRPPYKRAAASLRNAGPGRSQRGFGPTRTAGPGSRPRPCPLSSEAAGYGGDMSYPLFSLQSPSLRGGPIQNQVSGWRTRVAPILTLSTEEEVRGPLRPPPPHTPLPPPLTKAQGAGPVLLTPPTPPKLSRTDLPADSQALFQCQSLATAHDGPSPTSQPAGS